MNKILICILLFGSLSSFADRHHRRHHRYDKKEWAEKRAHRNVEALQDYVTGFTTANHDSIENYMTAYYSNAMTYSPTSKVRKKSRTLLDTRVTKVLSASQFDEYEVFMKDLKKKGEHRKGKHRNRHCPAFAGGNHRKFSKEN